MLGRLGVATARAFGWGLAADVFRVSHCVCPVDISKARIRKAGDSREVLYSQDYMYICTCTGMRNLAFFRAEHFSGHHNLAVAFCHMGNCGHPAQNFFSRPG